MAARKYGDNEHGLVADYRSRVRGIVATLNNYTTEEYDELCGHFYDECRYGVAGLEVGEQGTPHVQAYWEYKNPRVFPTELCGGRLYMRKRLGTFKQASDYCKKDGDYIEHGTLPTDQDGKGLKGAEYYENVLTLIDTDRLDELPAVEKLNNWKNVLSYQARSRAAAVADLPKLDNLWIHGPSGCGKSTYARTLGARDDLYFKPLSQWWPGYNYEPIVVIDDWSPFTKRLSDELKLWADHFAFFAEFKGGNIFIRPARIIVTSQYTINECWADAETRDAVSRRFTVLPMGNAPGPVASHFVQHYGPVAQFDDDFAGH